MGARHIMDYRSRDRSAGRRRSWQTYNNSVAASGGFGCFVVLNTFEKNQQAALGARLLNRRGHERIE